MKNSFWKNWKKFFGAFMVVTLLTACGKDTAKSNGGGDVGGPTSYSPLVTSNSAFNSFQNAVYNGQFQPSSCYGKNLVTVHYSYKSVSQVKDGWFGIDYTKISQQITDYDIRSEANQDYTFVKTDFSTSITNKSGLTSRLMSYIAKANPNYFDMDYTGAYRFMTNDNILVVIDLRLPLLAQPISTFNYNTQEGTFLATARCQ